LESKLNLDMKLVDKARGHAKEIAVDIQKFIDVHTTVTVERTVLRLLGVDGIDDIERPIPNIVVDEIRNNGGLDLGVSYWIGNAMLEYENKSPQEISEMIANGDIKITEIKQHDYEEIRTKIFEVAKQYIDKIDANRNKREEYLERLGEGEKPYLYVIVATGNIYEDVIQAKAAAIQGADIIAVIRTTAQSLLDYVPYGATTEGFGGTFATQENFKIMRKALDEVGEEVGRYIRLVNYASGLCMPEIAAMGALERLDVMLNDALYGILFRDINMQRTLVDQFFSRVINGYSGVIINTGEDNYLTTSDAYEEAHTVLASQLINEQFALLANLPEEQMGLGHAFEMNPTIKDGFVYELAQAQMAREIFPKAPLKYMPPTKYMTGDIFKGNVQDALFNMIAVLTKQDIQLLGMPTEAIHTPFLQDRKIAIENAKYIFNNMRSLGDDITYKEGGMIQTRAKSVLEEAEKMLMNIKDEGLMQTIEQGKFAGIKRAMDGGKGLNGVVKKDGKYFNPFIELMLGGGNNE